VGTKKRIQKEFTSNLLKTKRGKEAATATKMAVIDEGNPSTCSGTTWLKGERGLAHAVRKVRVRCSRMGGEGEVYQKECEGISGRVRRTGGARTGRSS